MSHDDTAWTHEEIPDLHGKTIVITGANSGIGYEAALHLAGRGAHVVFACRNEEKANEAMAQVQQRYPEALLSLIPLDLADLTSVRAFVDAFCSEHDQLNVLINNAGIMAIPRRETADGFEMQLGTNHLGHFALTGLLIERLLHTPASRVVNVSSLAHRFGALRFDDIQGKRSYDPWRAYGQSKLANLSFTYELDYRLRRHHADTIAVACHPGWAATNLQAVGPQMSNSPIKAKFSALGNQLFAQSAYMGALPTLYAAAADDVASGDFIGPDGLMQARGYPKKVRSNSASQSVEAGQKLWEVSMQLTGVRYKALGERPERIGSTRQGDLASAIQA